MTAVVKKSPWRQTAAHVRERGRLRPIVVALEPGVLVMRAKQCRGELRLPWALLYQYAAQAEADAKRAKRRQPIRRGRVA